MQVSETQLDERGRLQSLQRLEIMDTEPEPEFDELVTIAAAICGTPMSLVSLLDERRQWFKAAVGIDIKETPRDIAFCQETIRQKGLMLVEDAALDPRFAQNPFVTGEAGLRFYAGVPVASPDGHNVGALCVLDRTPRTLSPEQRRALRVLATQVNARLELRVQRRELERALAGAEAVKARLSASERRFQIFMDSGPFLGYLKDADGRMLYYNKPMADHFEVSRNFLLNKTDAELWPAKLAEKYRRHDLDVFNSGQLQIVDEETQRPDGSTAVFRSYKFPCTDDDGRIMLGGISVDVTEDLRREADLRRYQEEIETANRLLSALATVDALTGLANRRAFDEQFKLRFRQARRSETPLSLLMLDVDNFKRHNDSHGHAHGDELLRMLAQCLQSNLRPDDFPARYGGEEFTILLPNTTEPDALRLAERLGRLVRTTTWPVSPVTVSIGVSSLTPATPDTHRLLTLADEALYAAKRAGKDCAVSYAHVYQSVLAAAQTRISDAD